MRGEDKYQTIMTCHLHDTHIPVYTLAMREVIDIYPCSIPDVSYAFTMEMEGLRPEQII